MPEDQRQPVRVPPTAADSSCMGLPPNTTLADSERRARPPDSTSAPHAAVAVAVGAGLALVFAMWLSGPTSVGFRLAPIQALRLLGRWLPVALLVAVLLLPVRDYTRDWRVRGERRKKETSARENRGAASVGDTTPDGLPNAPVGERKDRHSQQKPSTPQRSALLRVCAPRRLLARLPVLLLAAVYLTVRLAWAVYCSLLYTVLDVACGVGDLTRDVINGLPSALAVVRQTCRPLLRAYVVSPLLYLLHWWKEVTVPFLVKSCSCLLAKIALGTVTTLRAVDMTVTRARQSAVAALGVLTGQAIRLASKVSKPARWTASLGRVFLHLAWRGLLFLGKGFYRSAAILWQMSTGCGRLLYYLLLVPAVRISVRGFRCYSAVLRDIALPYTRCGFSRVESFAKRVLLVMVFTVYHTGSTASSYIARWARACVGPARATLLRLRSLWCGIFNVTIVPLVELLVATAPAAASFVRRAVYVSARWLCTNILEPAAQNMPWLHRSARRISSACFHAVEAGASRIVRVLSESCVPAVREKWQALRPTLSPAAAAVCAAVMAIVRRSLEISEGLLAAVDVAGQFVKGSAAPALAAFAARTARTIRDGVRRTSTEINAVSESVTCTANSLCFAAVAGGQSAVRAAGIWFSKDVLPNFKATRREAECFADWTYATAAHWVVTSVKHCEDVSASFVEVQRAL